MATRNVLFPKRWFQASDLPPGGLVVRIAKVQAEKIGSKQEMKNVVFFKGQDKQLVLNLTNFDLIVEVTGEGDTENWPGKLIELFATKTRMEGKLVDCVRVRAPTPKGGPVQTVKAPPPAPAQEEPPAWEPDDSLELDDAIPV